LVATSFEIRWVFMVAYRDKKVVSDVCAFSCALLFQGA
jgi:hypothetical protein